MIENGIKKLLKKLINKEYCALRLARSFCVGVYIAFSPFPGLHTVMAFFAAWIFSLNIAIVFASSCLINNPWTMMPVYVADYIFGHLFFKGLLGIDALRYNPSWMHRFNDTLVSYTGIKGVSLWSFFVGGNLLGIGTSVMLYPIMKRLFKCMLDESRRRAEKNENSGSE